jgi:hypothetical protein
MAEFPDANSGGLDPQAGGLDPQGTPKGKAPVGRRARAWAIVVALYAIVFGMAAAGVAVARTVFRPGVALDDRLMHLLWAAGLVAPLGFLVRYFVRVRLKTGKWRGTPEQRQQDREQRLAKCSTVGGKRVCAAKHDSLVSYAVKWASYAAFARENPPWQRGAAWLTLVLYVLAVLSVVAFGVICFGAAFADDNTLNQSLLFIGLGVASLIWPAVVVLKLVRGIREGKVGTTREELDELRAQRSAWAARESQKPLRNKLIGTAVALVVYALWWMRVTVHHAEHPHESWVTPAIFTPALIYSIWVQFRRPKDQSPATES